MLIPLMDCYFLPKTQMWESGVINYPKEFYRSSGNRFSGSPLFVATP